MHNAPTFASALSTNCTTVHKELSHWISLTLLHYASDTITVSLAKRNGMQQCQWESSDSVRKVWHWDPPPPDLKVPDRFHQPAENPEGLGDGCTNSDGAIGQGVAVGLHSSLEDETPTPSNLTNFHVPLFLCGHVAPWVWRDLWCICTRIGSTNQSCKTKTKSWPWDGFGREFAIYFGILWESLMYASRTFWHCSFVVRRENCHEPLMTLEGCYTHTHNEDVTCTKTSNNQLKDETRFALWTVFFSFIFSLSCRPWFFSYWYSTAQLLAKTLDQIEMLHLWLFSFRP